MPETRKMISVAADIGGAVAEDFQLPAFALHERLYMRKRPRKGPLLPAGASLDLHDHVFHHWDPRKEKDF